MNDITEAMDSVKLGLSLFSDAIGLANSVKNTLPESKEKDSIEKSLFEADKAAKLAEAQIANALGYTLCQCTFPPQIMLSKGYKDTNYRHKEEFVCPKCEKSSIPPPDKPINVPPAKGYF